jgi:ribosomal protein S18 acetylase RimI-like enzyme
MNWEDPASLPFHMFVHDQDVIVRVSPANFSLFDQAVGQFRGVEADRTYLDAAGTLAFIATSEGEVIGWCWGYHLQRPDSTSMLYLHELEVAEAHRRQGIGKQLVAAFMAAGAERGATKLLLITEEANLPARSLYEAIGGRPAENGPTVSYWFKL